MPLETGVTDLDDLNAAWPVGTDPKSEGAPHLRNIKTAAQASDAARQAAIATNSADIGIIQTDLATVVADIAALTTRVETAEADISALDARLAAAELALVENSSCGTVNSAGTKIDGSSDWTVLKTGTGVYRLTFTNAALGRDQHGVTANADDGQPVCISQVNRIDASSVEVEIRNSLDQLTDRGFQFVRVKP